MKKDRYNFSNMVFLSCAMMILSMDMLAVNGVNAQYSDLPPPPQKPDRFTSKQQLKDYLVKLHEYYAIIGRPRFGKRSVLSISNDNWNNNQHEEEQMIHKIKLNKLLGKQNSVYSTLEGNVEPKSNGESFLQKILRSSNFAEDIEYSIPTYKFIELIDENNDGEITEEEFKNFMSYFNKDLCNSHKKNINSNNDNLNKDAE